MLNQDAASGDQTAGECGRMLRRPRIAHRHADSRQMRRGRTHPRVRLLAVDPEETLRYEYNNNCYLLLLLRCPPFHYLISKYSRDQ